MPMSSRERLQVVLNRKIPDRVPMVDISYWPETLERWRKEGLPEGISPEDYFELDRIPRIGFDCSLRLPEEVLEETEQWRIKRDANGVVIKEWKDWKISYAPPSRLDCLVKTWDDWLKVKERLDINPQRIGQETEQAYGQYRENGWFTVVSPIEPCWFLIEHLTGFETGLPMMVEQPDLAYDIIETCTNFVLGMCELCMERGMTFDGVWFFSDLCYKNGMLFSPNVYRDLLMPHHRHIKGFCQQHNMPLLLHCDGDVREFVPLLIEVGFDAIQPLEARCGNDVRKMKKQHGTQIVFFGNIGTDVMATGDRQAIEEEVVTKVTAAKEGGGYIYHCDHSIPPTVSLETYRLVIELVRQYGSY